MSLNGRFYSGPVTGPKAVVFVFGWLYWLSAPPRTNTAIISPIRLPSYLQQGQNENIHLITLYY